MTPFRLLILLLFTALSACTSNGAAAGAPQEATSKTEELVRQSSLVFTGTVKKLNATTVPMVSASQSTAIVRVEEIVHNAGVVTDIAGKEITVELLAPGSVKPGERAMFYTNVDTYGESLAVTEVSHEAIPSGGAAAMRTRVAEIVERVADEKLQKRVAQAELIVAGRVTAARPYGGSAQHAPGSEHDPEWWEANVKVESVEKGQAPPAEVVVIFPHSNDVRWFGSPKFKEGQEGIFLLHRTKDEQLRVSGFTALDSLDYQPMDQREHVRKLTQKPR
jgi:hypothetical protein